MKLNLQTIHKISIIINGETLVRGMESLTNQWRNLSLDEREGGKLSIKKNRSNLKFTIAAKFLTT